MCYRRLDHICPSWCKRFLWNLGMPIVILLVLNLLALFFATSSTLSTWICSIQFIMFLIVVMLLLRTSTECMQVQLALLICLHKKEKNNNNEEERDEIDIIDIDNDPSMKLLTRDIILTQQQGEDDNEGDYLTNRLRLCCCCCFGREIEKLINPNYYKLITLRSSQRSRCYFFQGSKSIMVIILKMS